MERNFKMTYNEFTNKVLEKLEKAEIRIVTTDKNGEVRILDLISNTLKASFEILQEEKNSELQTSMVRIKN